MGPVNHTIKKRGDKAKRTNWALHPLFPQTHGLAWSLMRMNSATTSLSSTINSDEKVISLTDQLDTPGWIAHHPLFFSCFAKQQLLHLVCSFRHTCCCRISFCHSGGRINSSPGQEEWERENKGRAIEEDESEKK